jgi:hypothetical protein
MSCAFISAVRSPNGSSTAHTSIHASSSTVRTSSLKRGSPMVRTPSRCTFINERCVSRCAMPIAKTMRHASRLPVATRSASSITADSGYSTSRAERASSDIVMSFATRCTAARSIRSALASANAAELSGRYLPHSAHRLEG